MPLSTPALTPPEASAREYSRVVKKSYKNTEVHFSITVLPEDVRINAITHCGRDIFNIVDPEIRRAAYEDFKSRFVNHAV